MGKYEKLLQKIVQGTANTNIPFDELCQLLKRLGFEERIRGGHHIFRREGIEEKPNLQKDTNKAKAYQVRQIREIIVKYHLGE
ncbi:type II toxin-antitoxin system HicA family toxin [Crocosphaera sp. UHCC 0190]|uniref:type II toxin-antitoxin system HicA family toxin n=1 Tax=Crocosphaera sp. UHCC 0190 TaxID=3110246 RepID=UPI002B1ECDA8|nr:type II toxin-antitoxin system HicA family toxin [Crocosphaera sp. UHCC 0190]MEA5510203.1 type II toxin-antitoxin system HicA family toxin [Crocosphaera sp. UHCC 0190]